MFDQKTEAAITHLAAQTGIEPAALLAIAEVESGGVAGAWIGTVFEPLIRFEGHYFDRRLSGLKQKQARAAGLSDSRAGAVKNPAAQTARWALLKRAAAIHHQAAHESVSWGLGQVMGAHWKWLGYASVDALVTECRTGVEGQVRLMLRYCEKAGLLAALRAKNWAAFAKAYNGPAYAVNRYDQKMAAAYARHKTRLGKTRPSPSTPGSTSKPAAPTSTHLTLVRIIGNWFRRKGRLSSV